MTRPARPWPTRRHCQRLVAAGVLAALLPTLGACASHRPGEGARSQLLTAQRLQELLARQFPYTRRFSGLAELTLRDPRLSLLPASNRLATTLELELAEHLSGQRFRGELDLDYGLRFDAREGAVRMADVRVNRLDIDALPRVQQPLVSRLAPRLIEQLLAGQVLYRLPPEQLALARNLGLGVDALRVLPEGLRIELRPQPLR